MQTIRVDQNRRPNPQPQQKSKDFIHETLAITPIAIVLALTPGPRLRSLLRFQIKPVRGAMSWAVVSNLLAVAIGIVDLIIDSKDHADQPARWIMATFEFAALLAMVRLVWFFVSLLILDEVDQTDSGPLVPPQ